VIKPYLRRGSSQYNSTPTGLAKTRNCCATLNRGREIEKM